MWNVAEKSIYYHNYLFIYHFKFPTLSLWWLNTYHVECNSEFICHFVKKMTWVFRIVNSSWCFHSPIFSLYCSELVSHTYPYILCLSSSIIIYNGIMFFGVGFTCIYKNGAPYRRFASSSLYDRINCQFHQSHSWVPPHIDHGVSCCPDLTLFLERGLLVVFIEYFTNTASVSFNSYISLNKFSFWFLIPWLLIIFFFITRSTR